MTYSDLRPTHFSAQFSGVIGFIFFLELTAAVLAVVFQSQVREWINEFFLTNVKAYRDDIDLQNLIDSLQRMVNTSSAYFWPGLFMSLRWIISGFLF